MLTLLERGILRQKNAMGAFCAKNWRKMPPLCTFMAQNFPFKLLFIVIFIHQNVANLMEKTMEGSFEVHDA